MGKLTEEAYRTAVTLIDEGSRSLAKMYKDNGSSTWKAKLEPREHADLVLRLAHALADEEKLSD